MLFGMHIYIERDFKYNYILPFIYTTRVLAFFVIKRRDSRSHFGCVVSNKISVEKTEEILKQRFNNQSLLMYTHTALTQWSINKFDVLLFLENELKKINYKHTVRIVTPVSESGCPRNGERGNQTKQ